MFTIVQVCLRLCVCVCVCVCMCVCVCVSVTHPQLLEDDYVRHALGVSCLGSLEVLLLGRVPLHRQNLENTIYNKKENTRTVMATSQD